MSKRVRMNFQVSIVVDVSDVRPSEYAKVPELKKAENYATQFVRLSPSIYGYQDIVENCMVSKAIKIINCDVEKVDVKRI